MNEKTDAARDACIKCIENMNETVADLGDVIERLNRIVIERLGNVDAAVAAMRVGVVSMIHDGEELRRRILESINATSRGIEIGDQLRGMFAGSHESSETKH